MKDDDDDAFAKLSRLHWCWFEWFSCNRAPSCGEV